MNTYVDERGEIAEIAEGEFKSFVMITSKKGAIRANHYHKRGGHLCYIVSGCMRYLETGLDDQIVGPGDYVFTGPNAPHAMEFLEDTVMVCLATMNRADGAYEDDLVRVKVL